MEALIKLQCDIKTVIEKAQINFRKSPKDRLTKSYIETRMEILDEKWKKFSSFHDQIIQCADHEVPNPYSDGDIYELTEVVYTDYKCQLKDALEKVMIASAERVSLPLKSESNNSVTVKLPTISIPTFSGNYTEWVTFRDLFVSMIHNNASLDNVQKLHYMKAHLSGEAEQLLRHVPVTSANYAECWSLLNHRYNNKRYLSNCILKRFMGQPAIATESSKAIKDLLDTTVDSLNALKNLGIDVDSWDVIVVYIVSSKLDSESRKQWEASLSTSDDLPKFYKLKEFLESKFRSLEFLDDKFTKSNPAFNRPRSHHVLDPSSNEVCPYCKEVHRITQCKKFANEDYDIRYNFVQMNRLCFNCLGFNHPIRFCRSSATCRICNRKHHSLLHPKSSSTPPELVDSPPQLQTEALPSGSSQEPVVNTHISINVAPNQVLLATALVEAQTGRGHSQLLRALVDQGSQASFITESAVQLLGLKKTRARSTISGVGGDQGALACKHVVSVTIRSRHCPEFITQVQAYVLGTITSLLPTNKITPHIWPELHYIALADPEYHTPSKIDILLGAEVYGQIIREGLIRGPPGKPIAQNTVLGWILSGQTQSRSDSFHCHNVIINAKKQVDDNEMLKRFWEIESDDCCHPRRLTQEEERCEEFFMQTTQRDITGRYVVRLPFRDEDPQCKYGNSREIAVKRFQCLENKFQKNPEIKNRYSDVMQEYLDLGHMEIVQTDGATNSSNSEAVYLPHHAVIREDKTTTKVRVVFDASCKGSNGVSLNDTLMVGPKLQPDLRQIVMKWRSHPICLCADIVKMYRQIRVADDDADFQRLVWRDDTSSEVKDYKLGRVTFGTASAPYLAVKSLQQLAIDECKQRPKIAEIVKNDFYVDDLMTGCQTIAEGRLLHQELKEELLKGGFELQKWISNCKELLDEINDEKELGGTVDIKLDDVIKILGLCWDRETDSFKYSVHLPPLENPITKRKVVSDISRLFDPLGWVAPCVVTAKVMIQKLWLSGIDWDEELPNELLTEWKAYRYELIQTNRFSIPRWVETKHDDSCVELHGFCDASNLAYAAVIYIRVVDNAGGVKVNLVTAKTKVAPTKQVSIPRLELMGAVLLAKLIREVAGVLNISLLQIHGWTDSTIVLAWLSSHPSRWKTFVANRVSDILTWMDNTRWAHVQSAHNPADIASRGMSPLELSQSLLWKQGPSWLQRDTIEYTRPKAISNKLEERTTKANVAMNVETQDSFWTKYSSLNKLVRVIAYCRRFLRLRQPKEIRGNFEPYLTCEELSDSLEVCIKQCQNQEFQQDLNDIKETGNVGRKSKLKPLCPMVDEKGILRVSGRIQNAQLAESIKRPIIIPQRSHFTDLIIDEAHKKTFHGGPTLMINYLRTKYWVISARDVTRSHVRRCVPCVRYAATAKTQLMGQLPSSRVTPSRPFLHSGVDFAGPINMRISKGRGCKSYKGYICLFVCMVTRAVHLEPISDLTAQGFIAGFKRFVARRDHCSNMWSDNGTNFVGASKELKALFAAESSSISVEIRGWLSNNNVTWHFIPPHAPNFGGLWEAGIKSTKFHLKRVIGNSTLTYEEMSTVLSQIEACLNSRPISQVKNTGEDPMPLTPGHFLIGEPIVLVPECNYELSNVNTLRRWQMTQRMVQDFWRRWSEEYLVHIMQRYKWFKQTPEPNLGDVVLVKEDNLPPARWLLGRIVGKHPGLDNVTRVVTLKCNDSLIKRPTSKLCILPVSD